MECLPSATVAEIFFLHERAYRLGIYTLLLLGGKNLIPLVSAVIVQAMGWRWVFWSVFSHCRILSWLMIRRIVAITVGFCFFLIFFFVPETFWDRAPRPRDRTRTRSTSPGKHHQHLRLPSLPRHPRTPGQHLNHEDQTEPLSPTVLTPAPDTPRRPPKALRVGFADEPARETPSNPQLHGPPTTTPDEGPAQDYFSLGRRGSDSKGSRPANSDGKDFGRDLEKQTSLPADGPTGVSGAPQGHVNGDQVSEQFSIHYTDYYRDAPPKSYRESLKPWNGRLAKDKWLRVAARPFILFAYPAVLWSSLVYSLAVGWLIVLSESVSHIYRTRETYNFTALQVGLVYVSPFIGGILGTAIAGKFSDIVVRFMARKNDGVYEPEFRLLMAIPIAISTVIGLMGFGWSAEEKDSWIVPTIFFGVISFGCSLASTTAVTFVVDSYRQYAGEALVTLNVCKSKRHLLLSPFAVLLTHS